MLGCRTPWTLICWSKWTLLQSLWETVWQNQLKFKHMCSLWPYVPFSGTYQIEVWITVHQKAITIKSIAAFHKSPKWKEHTCLSQRVDKLCCIPTAESHVTTKANKSLVLATIQMNLVNNVVERSTTQKDTFCTFQFVQSSQKGKTTTWF